THPFKRKDIFENLGAEVNWDSKTRTVIGTKDKNTITLQIDTNAVTKNGVPVKLAQPAEIINGRTMIPLKFVSETLGAEIKWEQETRTVHILTVSLNSDLLSEAT
ncbi:MAG: copper amine oxidase N-terminal domain-containing protein, partial [Bacilli bacterium]